jgi:hypothetical protein
MKVQTNDLPKVREEYSISWTLASNPKNNPLIGDRIGIDQRSGCFGGLFLDHHI